MTETAKTSPWITEYFDSAGTCFGLSGAQKLDEVKSPYQTIEIYSTETFGNLMLIDGCMMVSTRDNFLYHEMMSHPALFTHKQPETAVIIGGGDCGTLREVLKHDTIKKAYQIDIDEQVTRLSEKYFPELCESNSDPRAELLFIDGIKWVQKRDDQSVDMLIIDSTDPVGLAEGLFTVDFLKDCFRVLKPGGIIVQQSESPILHSNTIIKNLHTDMHAAEFSDTQTLTFPQPIYPSGWWSCTMALKATETMTTLDTFRMQDAENKLFNTAYYSPAIHEAAKVLPPFMFAALADTHT